MWQCWLTEPACHSPQSNPQKSASCHEIGLNTFWFENIHLGLGFDGGPKWPRCATCLHGALSNQGLKKGVIPVVPHKAVAEVSKIGNLYERLVVVNQGWQSESTDGPKGA